MHENFTKNRIWNDELICLSFKRLTLTRISASETGLFFSGLQAALASGSKKCSSTVLSITGIKNHAIFEARLQDLQCFSNYFLRYGAIDLRLRQVVHLPVLRIF